MTLSPELHLIRLKNIPIYQQLQLEEALLRTDTRNWCLINSGSPPAIVMGISGQMNNLVNTEKLNNNPIDVIRRFSGGGTVVVDEETLFISLICNRAAIPVDPFPNQILCWAGSFFRSQLSEHGFCVKENDYVLGPKKFGGNAQYITKDRWVHHSTLLWDYDPNMMDLLSIPEKQPDYRKKRSHEEFVCTLSEVLKDKELFLKNLVNELGLTFSITITDIKEAEKTLKHPHRKATNIIKPMIL